MSTSPGMAQNTVTPPKASAWSMGMRRALVAPVKTTESYLPDDDHPSGFPQTLDISPPSSQRGRTPAFHTPSPSQRKGKKRAASEFDQGNEGMKGRKLFHYAHATNAGVRKALRRSVVGSLVVGPNLP